MSPRHLIEAFGTLGVLAIIFAESGLLIGFFLPGDSLLFTAGVLSAERTAVHLNLAVVVGGCFVAAVAGAQAGYEIGRRAGPRLFARPDSRLFKRDHVDRAEAFFDRYGAKTVVLSRFVPVVRTFATVVAGVARMDARRFFVLNVLGALPWAVGVTLLGYELGQTVQIDRYLLPVVAAIIAASFLPVGVELFRARRRAAAAAQR
ncbi:MAG TPA: DedA family protein [Acidimicrobiales bacterium]|nr:DedA family protein [Acidimicrobiales bacterium]